MQSSQLHLRQMCLSRAKARRRRICIDSTENNAADRPKGRDMRGPGKPRPRRNIKTSLLFGGAATVHAWNREMIVVQPLGWNEYTDRARRPSQCIIYVVTRTDMHMHYRAIYFPLGGADPGPISASVERQMLRQFPFCRRSAPPFHHFIPSPRLGHGETSASSTHRSTEADQACGQHRSDRSTRTPRRCAPRTNRRKSSSEANAGSRLCTRRPDGIRFAIHWCSCLSTLRIEFTSIMNDRRNPEGRLR